MSKDCRQLLSSKVASILERQGGPFRGFEKLEQHSVIGPNEAADLVARLRRQITSGRYSKPAWAGAPGSPARRYRLIASEDA